MPPPAAQRWNSKASHRRPSRRNSRPRWGIIAIASAFSSTVSAAPAEDLSGELLDPEMRSRVHLDGRWAHLPATGGRSEAGVIAVATSGWLGLGEHLAIGAALPLVQTGDDEPTVGTLRLSVVLGRGSRSVGGEPRRSRFAVGLDAYLPTSEVGGTRVRGLYATEPLGVVTGAFGARLRGQTRVRLGPLTLIQETGLSVSDVKAWVGGPHVLFETTGRASLEVTGELRPWLEGNLVLPLTGFGSVDSYPVQYDTPQPSLSARAGVRALLGPVQPALYAGYGLYVGEIFTMGIDLAFVGSHL